MNPLGKVDAASENRQSSRPAWQDPPALTLDESGMICDCSKAGEKLFGYLRQDMVWRHVSKLLPELSEIQLLKNGQVNPQLGFLCHCGHHFQTTNRLGNVFMSELHFVILNDAGTRQIRMIVQPSGIVQS
ncbi:MAG: PAS domain-containing protein [Gallionella sp.]|nr:PAS domain-containing protein [Gallionella sp.]